MATADYYRAYAVQAATKAGINPAIFVRQINAESGFNPNSGSSAGAIGIAQFMPGTAKSMGINPRDPEQSLDGAAKLMARLIKKYHGSYQLALAAYNSGEGNVAKAGNKVPNIPETQNYVKKILGGQGGVGAGLGTSTQFSIKPGGGKLGAIEDAALSPIKAAGGALGTPLKGIEAVGSAMLSIGHLFVELFDPKFWLRIGKVIAGVFIIALCLWRLTGASMPPIIPV